MKILPFLTATALIASPALSEEPRKADAHEHGVGQLDIAFDGAKIAIELHAPGADIAGFEYGAESDEDLAKVNAAIESLSNPLDLFILPTAAGCSVIEASAELEGEDEHHDEHEEEHAEEHDEHEEQHGDHDDHEDEGHTEFHAQYLLECSDPAAVTEITFEYFNSFPNALELEVQAVSAKGAGAFEVERDAPTLDLNSLF